MGPSFWSSDSLRPCFTSGFKYGTLFGRRVYIYIHIHVHVRIYNEYIRLGSLLEAHWIADQSRPKEASRFSFVLIRLHIRSPDGSYIVGEGPLKGHSGNPSS